MATLYMYVYMWLFTQLFMHSFLHLLLGSLVISLDWVNVSMDDSKQNLSNDFA